MLSRGGNVTTQARHAGGESQLPERHCLPYGPMHSYSTCAAPSLEVDPHLNAEKTIDVVLASNRRLAYSIANSGESHNAMMRVLRSFKKHGATDRLLQVHVFPGSSRTVRQVVLWRRTYAKIR